MGGGSYPDSFHESGEGRQGQERNRPGVTAQMNSSLLRSSFQKCQRGGRRESENKRGGRDKPGHDEAKRLPLRHHHGFRLAALSLDHELVESAEIGVSGRHERIRVGPLRGHRLAVLR